MSPYQCSSPFYSFPDEPFCLVEKHQTGPKYKSIFLIEEEEEEGTHSLDPYSYLKWG